MESLIPSIIEKQRLFFNSGKTFDIDYRKRQLIKLKKEIQVKENEIESALFSDLGKSRGETFLTEIHFIYSELNILN